MGVLMTVGSLFSGIGGLDLGLERAGMRVVWQCEKDEFCRRVLAKHWPGVPCYEDVKDVDEQASRVDLIAGGFPCQNLSHANIKTRTGLAGVASGLWSEFLRVVRVLNPRCVLVENIHTGWREWVPTVRRDLWAIGYPSVSTCVRASDVGAAHERARVFVLASNANSDRESAISLNEKVAGLREIADAPWQDGREPTPEALGIPHGVPERVARLRALGNAVVPQVAEVVGRMIMGVA